ncbi:hypothetical protein GCM10022212_29020 [Actimicrobium antarcticum]|uniref:Uncharacterized protein n=1 Tax=Actimicrobium antarcticum TaxID=1051899 RepID=A0ABP7TNU9_9BURK
MHDSGCCTQVEQIYRTTRNISKVARQLEQLQGIGIARHQHSKIEVAVRSRCALYSAAEGMNSQQSGYAVLQNSKYGYAVNVDS